MPKKLDLAGMFKSDADDLKQSRDKAMKVHPTDIRAAGNEIEEEVRSYLRRMLPSRYYVTHGHLIDSNRYVSPQLDVIVSDNLNLPSLVKTKDGTEYVPITSALAIGEIKSTYYRTKNYYKQFRDKIRTTKSEMSRPLVKNTFYGGMSGESTIQDITFASPNKYINNLYCFMLGISGGDFSFEDIKAIINSTDANLLPNLVVLLDKGVIGFAKWSDEGNFKFHKYPNEVDRSEYDWFFAEAHDMKNDSSEAAHLALLYGQLINHLSTSRLEPANVYPYTSEMSVFRKSSLRWAHDKT